MPFGYTGNFPDQKIKNSGIFSPEDVLNLNSVGEYGGSLELIEEQSITSSTATMDFTNIKESLYDVHLLEYKRFEVDTSNARPILRFYESGVLETANVYKTANQQMRSNGTFSEVKSTGHSYVRLGGGGSNSDDTDNGYVYIYNAGNSSKYTFTTCQTTGIYFGDNGLLGEFGCSVLPQASVVDGIQILTWSTGNNITNLQAKLYGVKQI